MIVSFATRSVTRYNRQAMAVAAPSEVFRCPQCGVQREQIAEMALVHLPLFTFKYSYSGRTYTAVVEAATGSVFANIYPAKAEAPYILAGAAAALTFLCLALVP